jgi:predicted ATP-dependent serine protease
MIVAILVGVVTIIGGILGVIKFLSWWQERQQALQRVCSVSCSVACFQCDTCWCHQLSQSLTPVSDAPVQDKDTCVMQAQAPSVDLTDAPAVAPRVEAAFYKPPDMLEDVMTVIQAETKHHVFVSGAPGIGKSAMAAAVHARCMKVRASLIR